MEVPRSDPGMTENSGYLILDLGSHNTKKVVYPKEGIWHEPTVGLPKR